MSNEKKKWSILDGIELSDPEEMEELEATRIPAGVPSSRPKIRAGRSARENTPPRSNTGPCTTWSGKDG